MKSMHRVLVVDDKEDNLYLLRALLEGHKYEVVTAGQGADALEKARQNPPDLIISDILMPVMDGFALCREWKKDERLKAIPFVFYTATYTDERDREFALSLGADRFIVKPEEPDAFMTIIRSTIRQVENKLTAPAKPTVGTAARRSTEVPGEEDVVTLKQYNEALIRRVEAKMAQLEQAKRDLEQELDERRRTEQALRASEDKFAKAFRANPNAMAISTLEEGRYLEVNESFVRVSGYQREDVIGRTALELSIWVNPDARLRIADELRTTGRVNRRETLFRSRSGEIRVNLLSAETIEVEGVHCLLSVPEDITERKLAEEQLRISEERLRLVLDGLGPHMFVGLLDPEGVVLVANQPALAAAGVQLADVLGKSFADTPWFAYSESVRQRLRAAVARAAQGETVRYDEQLHAIGGQLIWVDFCLQPLRDETGRIAFLVPSGQVVTERKRAEASLRASEERFRRIAETITEVFWIADVETAQMLYISPAYEQVWGRSVASLYENPRSFLESIHPEDLPRALTYVEGKRKGGPISEEYRIVRPDGSTRWIWDRGFPVRDETGQVTRYVGVAQDITERKRVEALLAHERDLLRALMDSVPDKIYFKDLDSRFVRINRAHASSLGLTDPSQALGKTDFDVHPSGMAAEALQDEKRVLSTGEPLVGKIERSGRADGAVKWNLVTKVPIKNNQGQVVGLVGISRDISARVQTEEALRESEERLALALEAANEGLWDYDIANDKLYCSSGLFTMLGYSPGDFPSGREALVQLLHPDEWDSALATIQEHLAKKHKSFEIELRVKTRTEGWCWILCRGKVVAHDSMGRPQRMVGTHLDINERKHTQAENTRLATAIEQSAEAVVITDVQGNIEYVNPAFTRITGYTREEVLGQNPRILKSGKHDAALYQELWATILKGETWRGKIINRRKDGAFYTEEMNVAPVRSPYGEATHFIATQRDVTRQDQIEEHLRQVQKIEAVGRLAGGVAHDFNNLLTIICGYGQLLRDRVAPNDRSAVEEILKASDRAAALTRQLLAFSRRQLLTPQVLDLNSVIVNIENMLRRLIREDIELTTVPHPGLWHVKADPGQIEQVIMNLVVNARDAMPDGGKITIETTNTELDKAYASSHFPATPGSYVSLAITDTGCGMDKEIQAHIFEPFFTTKVIGKGTGLGLATVYGIVKQSAGYIWVYSEPGQGSTFKIYLPRVEQAATETAPAPAPELKCGSETVLLVEDEEAVRSLVCAVLRSKGYNVLEATEPFQALSLLDQTSQTIHLLLTDVVMPQMSGRELAGRLTALRPDAKVLYMSGYADDAIIRHGILEAGTPFLQKPFTPSALVQKVREVLDNPPAAQR